MSNDYSDLQNIAILGEGQSIEFKESPSKLDREIVAFANAGGGAIYCGISDSGKVVGTTVSNRIVSEIQDLARNCDPSICLNIKIIDKKVLVIEVPEGTEKPYQCSSGFFLRIGANSQKLKTKEINDILKRQQSFFDSRLNNVAELKNALSREALERYCNRAAITPPTNNERLLTSLLAAGKAATGSKYYLTNAGTLLFTTAPKKFIPESYLTAVKYLSTDKFSIDDRKEFSGDLISQIEEALSFIKRHISVSYEISRTAQRIEFYEYPLIAIREALVNAITHRDYSFQNSCIYLNIFSDRLEIENPGGIFSGISAQEIEGHSIRRNPVLADLLFRAGYGEKLGSGIIRIKEALQLNNNPPYEISATNFFSIRFFRRLAKVNNKDLNEKQLQIVNLLQSSARELTGSEIALQLRVSNATITRAMIKLINEGLVQRVGVGKATRYRIGS